MIVASDLYFFALATIVSYALRAASGFSTPTTTPPASVLCKMSGETIFSTTGKPIFSAARAASSADVASASCGNGHSVRVGDRFRFRRAQRRAVLGFDAVEDRADGGLVDGLSLE